MLGTTGPRVRLTMTIGCLVCITMLALVIMGTVGVNGDITFQTLDKGCILFLSVKGKTITSNNGYCVFPIIGGVINGALALIFLVYWSMVHRRKEEFAPRLMSILFLGLAFFMAVLSFVICGEIGIGLDKGCKELTGQNLNQCILDRDFAALYAAEVSAGAMGGFWLLAMVLEWLQFKGRPGVLPITVDPASRTTVAPH